MHTLLLPNVGLEGSGVSWFMWIKIQVNWSFNPVQEEHKLIIKFFPDDMIDRKKYSFEIMREDRIGKAR